MLYMPLYNGVSNVTIGHYGGILQTGQGTKIDDNQAAAPVVWFGTSIVQGGAASRPGAQWFNGLSRTLSSPILNWGFAGPGQMQLSVAKYLVQVQPTPSVIVIDCLPDMQPALVTFRTAPLVQYLRRHLPAETKILLVEGTDYTNEWLLPDGPPADPTYQQIAKRKALRTEFLKLQAAGDSELYYVAGDELLRMKGDIDLESPLVGGVHPSDLGQERLRHFWSQHL